jgi:hypothetical protein
LCIKPSTRRTSSRSSIWMTLKPLSTPMSTTTALYADEDKSPWTRCSTEAWLAPSCTWRTFCFWCVYALVFGRRRWLHVGRSSSGSSGIFDTLLSSVFGTRHPLPFRYLSFRMSSLWGVESIESGLRGRANFWIPHLFLGLLTKNLM